MVVKNAAKLTLSRGKVSIKSLIYDLVILLVLLAVVVAVLVPSFSGVSGEIAKLELDKKLHNVIINYNATSQGSETAVTELVNAFNSAVDIFVSEFLLHSITIIFVAVIVTRILFALKTVPTMDVVNSYMSTNSEYDFASNFVHNIKLSFRYAFAYSLVCLPFDALLFVYILFGIIPTLAVCGIFGTTVIVAVVCAIFALRRVFISRWVPTILVNGGKVWRALGESITDGAKHFLGSFIRFFAYSAIIWSVMVTLTISSFGVAAIAVFPLVALYGKVYDLVQYYESNAMRYYAEDGDVVVPAGAEEINPTGDQA